MNARPYRYEIHVEEALAGCQVEWFPNLTIAPAEDGDTSGTASTTLTGIFSDQSALFGVLARIRDLNLTLVSVTRRA
jgi:hypothetical protein